MESIYFIFTLVYPNSIVDMSDSALTSVAQRMDKKKYVKGDVLIHQDDLGDTFYALEEGEVIVTVRFCINYCMLCFIG